MLLFLAQIIKYKSCALSNLQPLWATTREIDGIIYEENLNKSRF